MGHLSELDRLLDFMEEHIDLSHLREIEDLQYDAILYRDVTRLPLSVRIPHDGYEQAPLTFAYHDPEKMLYNEILWSSIHSAYNSVRTRDDGPLMVRSNHGIGVIPSLFGCKPVIFNNEMPWVEPMSVDRAKKIFAKGVPDPDQSLGRKVRETYQYFHERLKAYPKCYQAIHITQPDLQGPYDILHHIIGNEAFILPFDSPALTKYIIDVITDTYIAFRRFIDPYLTDGVHGDAVLAHGLCVGGKVLIKADTGAANLSPEIYQRYEGEPDTVIMKEFEHSGGGSLHYCGGAKSWHNSKMMNPYLRCINYGNPELHDLAGAYAFLKQKKVAIVGWGNNEGYARIKKDIETGDAGSPIMTGVTLMCEAGSVMEAREIILRHRDISGMHREKSA